MPTVDIAVLRTFMADVFVATGAPAEVAEEVATVLADNQLAGHDSHGVLRMPQYLGVIDNGELDPTARPEVLHRAGGTALVSGNWGFGQVSANFAADRTIELAKEHGVASVSLVKTGHTGRLAAFTERASRQGVAMFMAIGTVGTPVTVPYGGREAVFGTNPISFSMPNGDGLPITLDLATSVIAAGKIKDARSRNVQLPPDAILTKDGKPTRDPEDFYAGGHLLPFGGHKGYGFAVMAELLSAAIVPDDEHREGHPPGCGVFMFGLAASAFRSAESYEAAVARIAQRIKAVPPVEGVDEVLLPGEPEAAARARRLRDGVVIPDKIWQQLEDIAARFDVDLPTP